MTATPTPPTRAQAIAIARDRVSPLHPFGGGYQFAVFVPDGIHSAWRESHPAPYWVALTRRSQALLDAACALLGVEYVQYEGGKWTDYVPHAPRNLQMEFYSDLVATHGNPTA